MEQSSLYLTGTGTQVRDRLEQWRAETGISYISLFDPGEDQLGYLAEEVVAPCGGPDAVRPHFPSSTMIRAIRHPRRQNLRRAPVHLGERGWERP